MDLDRVFHVDSDCNRIEVPGHPSVERLAARQDTHVVLHESGGTALRNFQMIAAERAVCDQRLDSSINMLELETQRIGDEAHRLRIADVPPDPPGGPARRELLRRVPDTEPSEHGRAESRNVHDPRDPDAGDIGRGEREGRDQRVGDEAGIRSAPDHGHAVRPGKAVDPACELPVDRPGIRRLLSGAKDVVARGESGLEVGRELAEERGGRDDRYVGTRTEGLVTIVRHGERGCFTSGEVAEISSPMGRIAAPGADNPDVLSRLQHPRQVAADAADAEQRDGNRVAEPDRRASDSLMASPVRR